MKKNVIIALAVLLVLCALPALAARQAKPVTSAPKWALTGENAVPAVTEYIPGQLVIKFKSGTRTALYRQGVGGPSVGIPTIDAKMSKWQVDQIDAMFPGKVRPVDPDKTDLSNIYVIKFSKDLDVKDLAMDFSADATVEYAEPLQMHQTNVTPNDPLWDKQFFWDIIDAQEAWDISKGSKDVIIGVIDTGVDWEHPDLADHIWVNPGEDINHDGQITSSDFNGVDDDGNGYVDDLRGWDFVDVPDYWDPPYPGEDGYDPDNNPMDVDGHGTHVSGIASAVTDNGIGVAGTGWGCTIMPVRVGYLPDDNGNPGQGSIGWGYQGIVYAVDNGANILNLSWGGGGFSQYEQDIMDYAWESGVLVFTSAGNSNTDAIAYPGGYDHTVTVAGTLFDIDLKYGSSNYGEWVDISAPGVTIYSTTPGNTYGYKSGTSMSCPVVCGVAGLVWALHPDWTPDRVALQLIETADNIDDHNPDYKGLLGSGRVNAYRAVTENPSSVQIDSYTVDDSNGNNDGIVDSDETIQVVISLKSFLDNVANVTATMSSASPYVTISQNTADFGTINKDQMVSNSGTPFVFHTDPNSPLGTKVTLQIDITGNGGAYARTKFINVTIQPLYNNHDINNVDFTLTSFGMLGFYDYGDTGESFGTGFQYPRGTENVLYVGSFMVGTASDQVSDCSYGDSAYLLYDWVTSEGGNFKKDATHVSDQDGATVYNDSRAENPIGIEVSQRSYAWKNAPDNDYVIVEYTMINNSGQTVNNLYAGVYMDWDIDIAVDNLNSVGYDADTHLGYMWSDGANYYGMSMLYPDPTGYRAVSNAESIYDNAFTDALKYQYLTEGFVRTQSNVEDDWSNMLSTGPFTLEPGATQVVTYAFMGGDDLSDIKANAQAAMNKYSDLAPSNIKITHTPLRDTENTVNPYAIEAEFSLESGSVESAAVYWKVVGDASFTKAAMTHGSGNTWTGQIPAQSEKQVMYYLEGTDADGRSSVLPNTAPSTTYSFYAGADVTAPVISDMTVLKDTYDTQGPFVVSATVNDNLGLDESKVLLKFKLNGGDEHQVVMTKQEGMVYSAEIYVESGLSSGDQISYYVSATDLAGTANTTVSATVVFNIVNTLLIDDFEGDASKWDTGNGWGINFFAHEGQGAMTDSPAGFYQPNSNNTLTLKQGYDFTSKSRIAISYYYILALSQGDSLYFEASRNGTYWYKLRSYGGDTGYAWVQDIVSLKQFLYDTNVHIRFRLSSNDDNEVADGVYLDDIYFHADTVMTSVNNNTSVLPTEYVLHQNYPNPFNPVTNIAYELPRDGKVRIEIYSVLGERIATLVDRQQQAGRYRVNWNALNDHGSRVSSGVYFYKITTPEFSDVKKMILLK